MENNEKISVIFVCTGNSCRSQMAEGFMRHWAGDRIRVVSAGSQPATEVARLAVQVMAEVGIDISDHVTNSFDDFIEEDFDWVITLCDHAKDFCPIFTGKKGEAKRLHWSIPDPMYASNNPALKLKAYRDARDDIAQRIVKWLDENLGMKVRYDPN
jgi:arsenate reductase (thioredoxin)